MLQSVIRHLKENAFSAAIFATSLLFTPLAHAATRGVIPVVGSTAGANGANFRTSLQLTNPTGAAISGKIIYRTQGVAGTANDASLAYTLAPHTTKSYDNIVDALGKSGLGSLDVTADGNTLPVVIARAFDDGGTNGTKGVSIALVNESNATMPGQLLTLVAPANSAARMNVGVRTLTAATKIRYIVYKADGSVRAVAAERSYAAEYFEQRPVADVAGVQLGANESLGALVVSGKAVLYATTTDNITNDPSIQFGGSANRIPVAAPASVNVETGQPITITLSAVDTDLEHLLFSISGAAQHGTLGTITRVDDHTVTVVYTPNAGFSGSDAFTFTVEDENGGSSTATVSLTVGTAATNHDPIASSVSATTPEDQALSVQLSGSDPDGDALTFSILTPPQHGTLGIVQSTGSNSATVVYTPNANYNGPDTFSYEANDGRGGTASANVSITVTPMNDAPTALNDAYSTSEDTVLNIAASGVLTNDNDIDGDSLTASLIANASNGNVALNANGSFTYTPNPNFFGTDTFTYAASDGTATQNATVTITVTAVNDAPSFTKGVDVTSAEDAGAQTVTNWATAISAGPANEAAQTLSFVVTNDTNAALFSVAPAVSSNGTLTYTAAPNANGTATITLVIKDNGGILNGGVDTSAPQTFVINVTAVNDPPSFTKGVDQTVLEDAAAQNVSGWATAISAGPTDEAGQTLTFNVSNDNNALFSVQPAISSTGTLTYTPAANAFGVANVTVTLTDNGGGANSSAPQSFTITVTPINDAPSFTKGADQTVAEDATAQTVNGWATLISAGPANEAGQTLTFNVTGNTNAALFSVAPAVDANGALTYTPAPNANGAATITLTLQDNGGTANGGVDTSAPQTFVINVTAVNDAPTVTGATVSLPENSANATSVTTVVATDVDSTNLTYAITAGNTGGAFAIDAATGAITVANSQLLDFETTPTFTLTVTVTDDGVPAANGTATITINLTDVNEAPTVNPATFAVDENSAASTAVGTVTFSDVDASQNHTFAITAGNTGNAFAINASTGAITVAGAIDFETTPSYSLTVQVTDNGSPALSGTATITINVNNLNEAPVVNPATFAIAENSANATAVGTATFTDADAGQTHTFAITAGNTGNAFAIDPSTGAITVANVSALDFETTPSFALTVQVMDNGVPAANGTATITINLTDVNEAPVVNPATFSTPENSTPGTVVGTVTFSDPDTAQSHTFSITAGNTGGAFAINASTGVITVVGTLDFATTPSYSLTVQVTDGGTPALSASATITINVVDVNQAPVVNPATFALNENSSNGTAVGTVTFTDADSGQTHTFAITAGNTGGAFAIDPSTGAITVANASALDFETTPSFSLTVQVTDNGSPNLSGTATITVNLNNVNEAPVVTPATVSVLEGAANGTSVTTMTFTDSDTGQTHTFAITAGNTGGAFAINAATGEITVANSAAIDFNTIQTFSLTVQVTDNGAPALSGTATATINVTDVNEAPVVNAATFAVNENSPAATAVGTVTFTDPDTAQTHTFAITAGNTGGAFAIDPSTGAITVAGALDFETTPSYSLTVQVTDNGSPVLSGTATITVNINNLNEAPVVNPATFSLAENSPNGTAVGTVTFTDSDTGQTHTFSITAGNTGGAFAINSSTGAITVANVAAVDFETNPTFSLTVQVLDNGAPALSGTATITVNLTNITEPPVVNAATFSIPENSANATTVGTVTASDPEGQTLTFSITGGNTGGAFAINPSTGVITVANSAAVNFETTPSFSLVVTATDTDAMTASNTITVNLTNVNEAPVVTPATVSLDENSANGTGVTTVVASDPDAATTLTYAITAGNTGGAFAINSSTGAITVANSAAVNFEVNPTFALTVQVTDNGAPALSGTATITINLNNLPEAPVVSNETFDTVGNTQLEVGASAAQPDPKIFFVGNLLANDTDPDTGNNVGLTTSLNTATAGAVVVVNSDGTFRYTPPAGLVNTTDSFTYNVSDGVLSSVGTVTINIRNFRVWYVKNDAAGGGLGRSTDPFNTLAGAQTASAAGDTIYVFFGNGTTSGQNTGIVLKATQRLLGEGVALVVPATVTVNGTAGPTLRVAGSQPLLDNINAGGSSVAATDARPAEVAGLNLAGNTNGLDVTLTAAFATSGTLSIHDDTVRSAGIEGIDLNLGGSGSTTLELFSITAMSTGTSIDVARTNGSVTVSKFANLTISGNTAASGIIFSGVMTFDAVPGGNLDVVNAGNFVIGASGNGVGGAGMILGSGASITGDISFNDLDVFADNGVGVQVIGTGGIAAATGTRLTVPSSVSIIESINGAALDLNNLTANLPLSSIKSTNSTGNGVVLTSVRGTWSAGSGSTITNASSTDFVISGGDATVSYAGTISDDIGQLVNVGSTTGGTKTFSGSITDLDDGDGNGISLTSNTGATIVFSGGVTLSTGPNAAFTATGGGTLSMTGTNKLTTTTGTALNVANTTIAAGNLNFSSITAGSAASGPVNGIILNTTGNSGGLVVGGGTIQKTTGDAISLTSVTGISLTSMTVQNSLESGIAGSSVNGLTLSSCTFTNNGDDSGDDGIRVLNLSGNVSLTSTSVNGSARNNIFIDDTTGTLATFNISGGTFNSVGAAFGANSILLDIRGTSTLTSALLSGMTLSNNNPARGITVQAQDTATITSITVQNSTFTNNGVHASFEQSGSANLTFKLLTNTTMTGATSHAVNVFSSSTSTGGTIKGRITGNAIGNAAVAGSGSVNGNAIRAFIQGKTVATLLLDSNTVRQTPLARSIDLTFPGNTAAAQPIVVHDVTVTNNNVVPNDTTGFPASAIAVIADNQGSPARVRANITGNTVPNGNAVDYTTGFLELVEAVASAEAELVDVPPASPSASQQLGNANTGSTAATAGVALIAGPITTPP